MEQQKKQQPQTSSGLIADVMKHLKNFRCEDRDLWCRECKEEFTASVVYMSDHVLKPELCPRCSAGERVCRYCNSEMFDVMREGEVVRTCVNSRCSSFDLASHEKRKRKELLHRFSKSVPVLYRRTDRKKLPDVVYYDRAVMLGQNALYEGRGFILHGETGRGKTRAMYGAIKEWYLRTGQAFKVFAADEFSNAASRAYSTDGDGDVWSGRLITLPLIALDDFGKGVQTERVTQTLFGIIEKRTAAGRPIVATTNDDYETLRDRCRDASTMAPLWRRLTEFCEVIG